MYTDGEGRAILYEQVREPTCEKNLAEEINSNSYEIAFLFEIKTEALVQAYLSC